jgi:hypothetical protein
MFIDNEGDPTLGAQELKTITDAESSPPSEPSSYTPSDLDSGLANLHLQDDSSSFTIHASGTVQNGKGAFATRDIQRGDLILSERPIFCVLTKTPKYGHVEAAVRGLSPADLDSYLSLHNTHQVLVLPRSCTGHIHHERIYGRCCQSRLRSLCEGLEVQPFVLSKCKVFVRLQHGRSPNPCSGYHPLRRGDLHHIHRLQTTVRKHSPIEASQPAHSVSFYLRVFHLFSPRSQIQDERREASEGK